MRLFCCVVFFCFKQKTAYEMRISDWSSDVCSSDLGSGAAESALESSRDGGKPAKTRCMYSCLYHKPEKAELGSAQGCQGPPDQSARSNKLYSRRSPSPSGTQCCAAPWRRYRSLHRCRLYFLRVVLDTQHLKN